MGEGVLSSTQSTEGYNGETTGELVLRVPSQKTGSLTSYIAQNSTVTKQSSQVLDITAADIETDRRLSALKAEKQALESLLNKAGSLCDIMTVQKQLTEVISQIEAAEAKFKKYNNEIEFDTVTLTVLQVQNSAADGGTVWGRITNGFSGSLHALGTFFTELLVILLRACRLFCWLRLWLQQLFWRFATKIKSGKKLIWLRSRILKTAPQTRKATAAANLLNCAKKFSKQIF